MKIDLGYKIKDGHYKLSSKIHLKDFVYAKRLIQNNYYASGFAFLLTKKILKKIYEITEIEKSDLTIFGYGYYSELLVSRIETFLNKHLNKNNENYKNFKINHFIIEDETNINFEKYLNKSIRNYKSIENHYLIIINPISTTLITPIKIENEFYKQLKEKGKGEREREELKSLIKIEHFPFYSLIVVENEKTDIKLTPIEKKFWENETDLENKIIKTRNRELGKSRDNVFFVKLSSKWYSPDNCDLCTPKNLTDESPLYFTDKVSVTPSYNFGYPDLFIKQQPNAENLYFNSVDDKNILINAEMINFGHYKGTRKHFFYYIIYEYVFKNNEKKIIKWAENLHDSLNKTLIETTDNILLITPDKSENGLFVNFINENVFNGRANILNVKAESENINDFKKFFEYEILQADKIFYIDNLIATANSFFLINDLIKLTREDIGDVKDKKNYQPFNGIFTLVNRMDKYTVQNVKRKLKSDKEIYSFMDLFFPVIPIHNDGIKECHLCRKEKSFKELVEYSALDTMKVFYYYRVLGKIQMKKKSDIHKNKGTARQLHRLFTAHNLFYAFSENKNDITDFFDVKKNNFDDFANWFSDTFSEHYTIDNKDKGINNKISILKVLCEQPFIEYKLIKDKLFQWSLLEIDSFIDKNKNPEILSFDFDYLKALVKTLAILKSNYLIRKKFICFIVNLLNNINFEVPENIKKDLFESSTETYKKKAEKLKLYISAYIKVSILENEVKTIKLEELLSIIERFLEIKKIKLNKEPQRFIDLLRLENINLLKIMLSIQENIFSYSNLEIANKFKYSNKKIHFDKIPENNQEIGEILNNEDDIKNLKVTNIINFVSVNDNKDTLNNYVLLNRFLDLTSYNNVEYVKNETIINNDEIFEEKANYLLEIVANILNVNKSTGGGLILYKFREESNPKDNYIIISSIGEQPETAHDFKEALNKNLFTTNKLIPGYNYMKDSLNNESIDYTWSSMSVYKKDEKWIQQDDKNDFIFEEAKIGNIRGLKRFNFIRITAWEQNKIKGSAAIVLYDKNTASFEQTKIRYILSIRDKINKFLEKNYNNDAFKSWIEKKNVAEIIKSRYNKFSHGAEKHLTVLKNELKKIDYDLFCYSLFIETGIWIGNKFSSYISNNGKYLPTIDTGTKSITKADLINLCKYLKGTERYTGFNINFNIEDEFVDINNAKISIDDISKVIYELYINATHKVNNSNSPQFDIQIKKDNIITKSINGRTITDKFDVENLMNFLEAKFPDNKYNISGIGLFVINKIIFHYFKENIKIEIDRDESIFEASFRIK